MKHWPADKVERKPIASLIPYARNARTHSDEQVAQIAASIREWGWTVPVLVDDAGGIIAGHCRVLAADKLGLADVPCMTATDWTDAQKRAYALADNRLSLSAGWDDDLLALELKGLAEWGFDLPLTGFNETEIAEAVNGVNFEPGTEDDQGRLDQLEPKMVECPHCGSAFDAREHGQV